MMLTYKPLYCWAKQHEIGGGRWIKISFIRYLWFKCILIVTCVSSVYPSESKDRGFAHSALRKL